MLDDGPPEKRDEELDLPENGATVSDGSLSDDIFALIDDGKVYAEAEIAFQKTRLAFSANQGKWGAAYGLLAFGMLHLALIGLVIGSILALTPLITAWGATGAVVGLLLLVAAVLGFKAKNRFAKLAAAYAKSNSDDEMDK